MCLQFCLGFGFYFCSEFSILHFVRFVGVANSGYEEGERQNQRVGDDGVVGVG